jgi:hypothetical protein
MKAMKRFLLFLACSGALLSAADLSGVRSVYVMPMQRGLDQFIANRLTNKAVFHVVTDPKLADAILTDRLGEAFRLTLDEIAPLPDPEKTSPAADAKDSDKAKDDKAKDEQSGDRVKDAPAAAKLGDPALLSTFGRGKGTLFLVDTKSRGVVWSTFEAPGGASATQMDRTAQAIVSRLKNDLKKK